MLTHQGAYWLSMQVMVPPEGVDVLLPEKVAAQEHV